MADCPQIQINLLDLATDWASLEEAERNVPRLSPADLARAHALAGDDVARRNWRAARIALRILLARSSADEATSQVDFALGPLGRPTLPSGHPHFSVSHSGNLALIVVSTIGTIGVDLETPRSVVIAEPRRARIVDAGQRLAGLPRLEGATTNEDFLQAWVRLEAVAKALGTGIGRLLTSQGVPDSRASDVPETIGVVVRDLKIPGGFAAVAAPILPPDLTVRRLSAWVSS